MPNIPEEVKEIFDMYQTIPVDDIPKIIQAQKLLKELRRSEEIITSQYNMEHQLTRLQVYMNEIGNRIFELETQVKALSDPFKHPEEGD